MPVPPIKAGAPPAGVETAELSPGTALGLNAPAAVPVVPAVVAAGVAPAAVSPAPKLAPP